MIGAPGKNIGVGEGGKTDVGVAYFFSGADGSLIRTLSDPDSTPDARFGFAIANAGDVDGDGVPDALLGAPGKAQVFVFSGKTGLLLFTIKSPCGRKIIPLATPLPEGKTSMATGSLICRWLPDVENSQGGAFIFKGSNGKLLRRLSIPSPQNFARAGASVAAIDDVTGDGQADIMVGVPEQDVTV